MESFNRINANSKKEWLENRINGIGGSSASAVLGLNNYMTNVDLWKIKTGKMKSKKVDEDVVWYGTHAEEPLRELFKLTYKDKYKVYNKEYEILQSKKYPFMLGSLDGEIEDLETGKKGVYEGKTARINSKRAAEEWKDDVPINYYIQILHYMLTTGYDFAIINVELKYEIDNKIWFVRKIFKFDRKDVIDDLKHLEEEEVKFWQFVEDNKEPPLKINF